MHWGPTVDGMMMLSKTPSLTRSGDTAGEAYRSAPSFKSLLLDFNAGRIGVARGEQGEWFFISFGMGHCLGHD